MPLGEFLEVADSQQAEEAGKQFGYPLMLKSRRLAYDGKGNAVVDSLEKLENAVQQLGGYKHGLYAEKWTPFVKVCIATFCLGSHLTSMIKTVCRIQCKAAAWWLQAWPVCRRMDTRMPLHEAIHGENIFLSTDQNSCLAATSLT